MSLQEIEIFLSTSKYFLIFIGAIIEGPVTMLSSGFLLHLGQFTLWPLYFLLVLGDFIGDVFWYFVGSLGARKFIKKWGHLFGITEEKITKAEQLFFNHQDKILFLSKITMGLGSAIAVLITAGMLHISFKRYVLLNLVGGILWTGFLVFIGFHFGNIYDQIPFYFKYPFLVIFVLAVFFLVKYFKKIQYKYVNARLETNKH